MIHTGFIIHTRITKSPLQLRSVTLQSSSHNQKPRNYEKVQNQHHWVSRENIMNSSQCLTLRLQESFLWPWVLEAEGSIEAPGKPLNKCLYSRPPFFLFPPLPPPPSFSPLLLPLFFLSSILNGNGVFKYERLLTSSVGCWYK